MKATVPVIQLVVHAVLRVPPMIQVLVLIQHVAVLFLVWAVDDLETAVEGASEVVVLVVVDPIVSTVGWLVEGPPSSLA